MVGSYVIWMSKMPLFIYIDPIEDIYINHPQGCVMFDYPNYVCKLNKSMLGMQTPNMHFLSLYTLRIYFLDSTSTNLFTLHIRLPSSMTLSLKLRDREPLSNSTQYWRMMGAL